MAQPSFTTDRLRLRRFVDDDAQFAFDLHRNPDLARFVPHALLDTLDDARAWIVRIRDHESATIPVFGWWLVELHDGTPVAAVVLKTIPASAGAVPEDRRDGDGRGGDGRGDVEIGWRQHADHTGHGYVTEAAAWLLQQAFDAGLPKIVAVTDPENAASGRVCIRLGMRSRGLSDAYYDRTLNLYEAHPPLGDGHGDRDRPPLP